MQQSPPGVLQADLKLAILPWPESAEIDFERSGDQFCLGSEVGGKPRQKLIETAIRVGMLGRFLGRPRQVHPAHAAEVAVECAGPEEVPRLGPVILTGRDQFVERLAGAAGRKHEGPGQTIWRGRRLVRSQRQTVTVTVERVVRIQ